MLDRGTGSVTEMIQIVLSSFSKSSVFKMFSVKTKSRRFNFKFLLFEKRFGKTRMSFHDGLVWTVGLTVEITGCVFKFLRPCLDSALGSLRENKERLFSDIND